MSDDAGSGHRALLIFPPFVETSLAGPHLGIGLLAAMLEREGISAEVLDLNVRLVRALFSPGTADLVCRVVEREACPPPSAREMGALDWFRRAAAGGWIDDHPHTVSYALRAVRRVLFPVPDKLEDCVSDLSRGELALGLYRELLKPALARRPSAVGISVAFSEQLAEALSIARLVRALAPETPILLGGSQINLLQPSQIAILTYSGLIDGILTTNGEFAIGDLVRSANRSPIARVTTSGPLAAADLQGLPHPVFDDVGLYLGPLTIPVLATKGCYWGKCSFCDYVRLSDLGGARYLARPVKDVLDEVEEADRRFAPARVMLVSDAVPPGWYRQLAKGAIERSIALRTWSYMMHHDHLDRGFFDLLANASVRGINFGTESTNPRILRLMRKQAAPDAIRANLRDAHAAGIGVISNVIADYPTLTFEKAVAVVRDFEELSPHIDVLNPSMFDLTAGTPAADNPACHRLNVPASAYQRTSHGYHSLGFEAESGLTAEQRLVLRASYDRLASRIRLRNRLTTVAPRRLDDADGLVLDRGVFRASGTTGSVKIPDLGLSAELEGWEAEALLRLLSDGGSVSVGVARAIAAAAGYRGDWVSRLVGTGLVSRVQAANASAVVQPA